MTSKIETKRPVISCDLAMHPKGAWKIHGKTYIPEWGISSGLTEEKAIDIINSGIDLAKETYHGKRRLPDRISIDEYADGRRVVSIVDGLNVPGVRARNLVYAILNSHFSLLDN
jgi:hypothetical protein